MSAWCRAELGEETCLVYTYLVLGAGEALADELTFERNALLHTKAIIVLRQARLPLLVHHQNELYHGA